MGNIPDLNFLPNHSYIIFTLVCLLLFPSAVPSALLAAVSAARGGVSLLNGMLDWRFGA